MGGKRGKRSERWRKVAGVGILREARTVQKGSGVNCCILSCLSTQNPNL